MRSSEYPNAAVIVREFLNTVAEAFAFLSSEPEFAEDVTVLSSASGSPVEPEELGQGGFFFASAELETSRVRVRVTYGDRELFINTTVSLQPPAPGAGNEYGLWEWIEALEISDDRVAHAEWVLTSARMIDTVCQSAAVLRDHLDAIANADAGVIATLELARVRRQEEWQEQEREREHRRIAAQAAEAFRVKDYARVVALLGPVRERLTPSEIGKLEYARQQLSSASN